MNVRCVTRESARPTNPSEPRADRRARHHLRVDDRLPHAQQILETMAAVDERVVDAPYRDVLGEAVREACKLPSRLIDPSDGDDWLAGARAQLQYACALLVRAVLSARALPAPSAAELLAMTDCGGLSELVHWREQDALWGRVAEVLWLFGEVAHVSRSTEADCIGALGTLRTTLTFLVALEPGGELARRPSPY